MRSILLSLLIAPVALASRSSAQLGIKDTAGWKRTIAIPQQHTDRKLLVLLGPRRRFRLSLFTSKRVGTRASVPPHFERGAAKLWLPFPAVPLTEADEQTTGVELCRPCSDRRLPHRPGWPSAVTRGGRTARSSE